MFTPPLRTSPLSPAAAVFTPSPSSSPSRSPSSPAPHASSSSADTLPLTLAARRQQLLPPDCFEGCYFPPLDLPSFQLISLRLFLAVIMTSKETGQSIKVTPHLWLTAILDRCPRIQQITFCGSALVFSKEYLEALVFPLRGFHYAANALFDEAIQNYCLQHACTLPSDLDFRIYYPTSIPSEREMVIHSAIEALAQLSPWNAKHIQANCLAAKKSVEGWTVISIGSEALKIDLTFIWDGQLRFLFHSDSIELPLRALLRGQPAGVVPYCFNLQAGRWMSDTLFKNLSCPLLNIDRLLRSVAAHTMGRYWSNEAEAPSEEQKMQLLAAHPTKDLISQLTKVFQRHLPSLPHAQLCFFLNTLYLFPPALFEEREALQALWKLFPSSCPEDDPHLKAIWTLLSATDSQSSAALFSTYRAIILVSSLCFLFDQGGPSLLLSSFSYPSFQYQAGPYSFFMSGAFLPLLRQLRTSHHLIPRQAFQKLIETIPLHRSCRLHTPITLPLEELKEEIFQYGQTPDPLFSRLLLCLLKLEGTLHPRTQNRTGLCFLHLPLALSLHEEITAQHASIDGVKEIFQKTDPLSIQVLQAFLKRLTEPLTAPALSLLLIDALLETDHFPHCEYAYALLTAEHFTYPPQEALKARKSIFLKMHELRPHIAFERIRQHIQSSPLPSCPPETVRLFAQLHQYTPQTGSLRWCLPFWEQFATLRPTLQFPFELSCYLTDRLNAFGVALFENNHTEEGERLVEAVQGQEADFQPLLVAWLKWLSQEKEDKASLVIPFARTFLSHPYATPPDRETRRYFSQLIQHLGEEDPIAAERWLNQYALLFEHLPQTWRRYKNHLKLLSLRAHLAREEWRDAALILMQLAREIEQAALPVAVLHFVPFLPLLVGYLKNEGETPASIETIYRLTIPFTPQIREEIVAKKGDEERWPLPFFYELVHEGFSTAVIPLLLRMGEEFNPDLYQKILAVIATSPNSSRAFLDAPHRWLIPQGEPILARTLLTTVVASHEETPALVSSLLRVHALLCHTSIRVERRAILFPLCERFFADPLDGPEQAQFIRLLTCYREDFFTSSPTGFWIALITNLKDNRPGTTLLIHCLQTLPSLFAQLQRNPKEWRQALHTFKKDPKLTLEVFLLLPALWNSSSAAFFSSILQNYLRSQDNGETDSLVHAVLDHAEELLFKEKELWLTFMFDLIDSKRLSLASFLLIRHYNVNSSYSEPITHLWFQLLQQANACPSFHPDPLLNFLLRFSQWTPTVRQTHRHFSSRRLPFNVLFPERDPKLHAYAAATLTELLVRSFHQTEAPKRHLYTGCALAFEGFLCSTCSTAEAKAIRLQSQERLLSHLGKEKDPRIQAFLEARKAHFDPKPLQCVAKKRSFFSIALGVAACVGAYFLFTRNPQAPILEGDAEIRPPISPPFFRAIGPMTQEEVMERYSTNLCTWPYLYTELPTGISFETYKSYLTRNHNPSPKENCAQTTFLKMVQMRKYSHMLCKNPNAYTEPDMVFNAEEFMLYLKYAKGPAIDCVNAHAQTRQPFQIQPKSFSKCSPHSSLASSLREDGRTIQQFSLSDEELNGKNVKLTFQNNVLHTQSTNNKEGELAKKRP